MDVLCSMDALYICCGCSVDNVLCGHSVDTLWPVCRQLVICGHSVDPSRCFVVCGWCVSGP